MSEKSESEEFEDEEAEEVDDDTDDLDIDDLIQDLDKRKRSAARADEPAWRRLERYLDEKRTAELLSDFDDYEIGDDTAGRPTRRRKRVD